MPRHYLAAMTVGFGYLIGLGFLPQLPGPYWRVNQPRIMAFLLAFTLPTAAAVISFLLKNLWRRMEAGTTTTNQDAVFSAIILRAIGFVIAIHTIALVELSGVAPRSVNGGRIVLLLLGLSIVLIGDLLPRVRPNHVIGIRTHRTMKEPIVWARTHRAAGYVLVGLGIVLSIVAIISPGPLMPEILFPLGAIGIAAVALAHGRETSRRIE